MEFGRKAWSCLPLKWLSSAFWPKFFFFLALPASLGDFLPSIFLNFNFSYKVCHLFGIKSIKCVYTSSVALYDVLCTAHASSMESHVNVPSCASVLRATRQFVGRGGCCTKRWSVDTVAPLPGLATRWQCLLSVSKVLVSGFEVSYTQVSKQAFGIVFEFRYNILIKLHLRTSVYFFQTLTIVRTSNDGLFLVKSLWNKWMVILREMFS